MIGLKWTEIGILSNFINQKRIYLVNEAHFEMFMIKKMNIKPFFDIMILIKIMSMTY